MFRHSIRGVWDSADVIWVVGRTWRVYWILGFIACTAAVLVPTPLVEPRYFMMPYLLLRIHCTAASGAIAARAEGSGSAGGSRKGRGERWSRWVWVEIAWNVFVNAVTIGVLRRRLSGKDRRGRCGSCGEL